MRTRFALAVGLAWLLAAVPAIAHHSFAAEFDATKPVKLTGYDHEDRVGESTRVVLL